MSNEAKKLMDIARQTSSQALKDYEEEVDALEEKLTKARNKAETLLEAAQAVCDHAYTTTVNWTEDGAFPNEPHSRMDCAICNKKGVM
ncbi:hypothetical protein VPHD181_0036 [Vibrio phage D181]